MPQSYRHTLLVLAVFLQIFFGLNLTSYSVTAAENREFDSKVVHLGKEIANKFLSNLMESLENVISNQGTAKAVAVYKEKVDEITRMIKNDLNNKDIGIKLLSPRYRDVENSPDYYEEQAYQDFQKVWKDTGRYPPYVIQEIRRNGRVLYRYYEPLYVKRLCLKCHGTLESLDIEAVKCIRQEHPNDNAVGYKLGDLRGFIRITIPQTFIAQ